MSKPINPSERPGDHFREATKYAPGRMPAGRLDWTSKPALYKTCEHVLAVADLPPADLSARAPLWPSIAQRRSVRDYAPKPLTLHELSQLLWASQGVTAPGEYALRAAPSAGALYPIETYLVVNNVAGLEPGVYHYRVPDHKLELLQRAACGRDLAEAALGQEMCASAAVVFVWTAIIQRSRWKYGQRAYRYIYLDAGHIAAHVSLAAVALGLGSCQIAAFFDDEVNAVVQVDGESEFAVYMTSVGHPAA